MGKMRGGKKDRNLLLLSAEIQCNVESLSPSFFLSLFLCTRPMRHAVHLKITDRWRKQRESEIDTKRGCLLRERVRERERMYLSLC